MRLLLLDSDSPLRLDVLDAFALAMIASDSAPIFEGFSGA